MTKVYPPQPQRKLLRPNDDGVSRMKIFKDLTVRYQSLYGKLLGRGLPGNSPKKSHSRVRTCPLESVMHFQLKWNHFSVTFLTQKHLKSSRAMQTNSDFSTKTSKAFPRCCNTLSQHLTVLWKKERGCSIDRCQPIILRLSELGKKRSTSECIFRRIHRWVCGFKTEQI